MKTTPIVRKPQPRLRTVNGTGHQSIDEMLVKPNPVGNVLKAIAVSVLAAFTILIAAYAACQTPAGY